MPRRVEEDGVLVVRVGSRALNLLEMTGFGSPYFANHKRPIVLPPQFLAQCISMENGDVRFFDGS